MNLLKVAAASLNQTPLAWDSNKRHILSAIGDAQDAGVAVLCLPELCITGYGCEDAFLSAGVCAQSEKILSEIIPHTDRLAVSVGLPVLYEGALFNCACLIANTEILGFVCKQNLAGEGLHYEPRWFKPWPRGTRSTVNLLEKEYPFGDLIFELDRVRIGFEICEDAWVADRVGNHLARRGVDIILNPSASHFAFDKHNVRKRYVIDGSRAFQSCYAFSNLVGNEAGRAVYDGDTMIASCGKLLAAGPRFSYHDVLLTAAIVDMDEIEMQRARQSSFVVEPQSRRNDRIAVPFRFPAVSLASKSSEPATWEVSRNLKMEEFTRVVSLALFDYLRKSRSRGCVVSLSGGADSSAVATLVACMVRLGVRELGTREFVKKLDYIDGLGDCGETDSMVRSLLTCVYQSTRNSSEMTRNAARGIARAVGADFLELDVDGIVNAYTRLIERAIGRELCWSDDDLALQNIQARARGPSVWLLANLRGALLLSTSNRSEAAVGYATMDGDMCGGLCPIAGIDKAFLRNWLKWMETEGPDGMDPIPELNAVNSQEPTAELRPPRAGQTDEFDLMPYDVLDQIERAAIRDKLMPLDVLLRLEVDFPQYTRAQLGIWVKRFFELWRRNQWKRERYAPSFHLDDENLDPKTWCRFPILSGGLEREVARMEDYVDLEST